MTEQEWLDCTNPKPMLEFVRWKYDDLMRLFFAACVRRVWQLLRDPRSREAVELTELLATGQLRQTPLDAIDAARNATEVAGAAYAESSADDARPRAYAAQAAQEALWPSHRGGENVAGLAAEAVGAYHSGRAGLTAYVKEREAQAHLLRDVLGNLFRTIALDRAWWTPDVLSLALAASEGRDLPAGTLAPERLAVLSDALEEAGCPHTDLLAHLRDPRPHVRGCWAIDFVRSVD